MGSARAGMAARHIRSASVRRARLEGSGAVYSSRRRANTKTDFYIHFDSHPFTDSDCYQDCHPNPFAHCDEDAESNSADAWYRYPVIYFALSGAIRSLDGADEVRYFIIINFHLNNASSASLAKARHSAQRE